MTKKELFNASTEILIAYIKANKLPYIAQHDIDSYPNQLLNEKKMKIVENYTKLSVKIAKLLEKEINNTSINQEDENIYLLTQENFDEIIDNKAETMDEMSIILNDFIQQISNSHKYEYLSHMNNLILNVKINKKDKYKSQQNKYDNLQKTINKFLPIYR